MYLARSKVNTVIPGAQGQYLDLNTVNPKVAEARSCPSLIKCLQGTEDSCEKLYLA